MKLNKANISNSRKYRRTIDITMSVLMLLVMSINIIGQQLHEYLGMLLGILFLIHLYLNRRWGGNLTKGRYTYKRVLQTVLNLALLVIMFVQMLSGIMIARYLPFQGPSGAMQSMTWIHTNAGYLGFFLMCLHAATHIRPFRKNQKIKAVAKVVFMLLISAVALFLITIWKQDNGKRKEAEYAVSEEMSEFAQMETGENDASSIQESSNLQEEEEEIVITDDVLSKETDEANIEADQETATTASNVLSGFQITFDFNRASTPASNQIAIWVEDETGNLVRTIMVTSFTGSRRGYEWRSMSLNHWLEKAQPQNISDSELDAISGATPTTGNHTFLWDLRDSNGNEVAEGNYVIKVEGTFYWESNILYQATVNTGNTGEISEITAQRSEPGNSQNEDMLPWVSIIPFTND